MLYLAYIAFTIYLIAIFPHVEQSSKFKFFMNLLLLLVMPTILLIVFWSVIFVTSIAVMYLYIFGREFIDDFKTENQ